MIAIISATGPFIYYDHNRNKRDADLYTLTAGNAIGDGPVVSIVLR